ncbi:hypothetical protein QW180_17165 [Vibrio sinaloensis]|nr:hypothetical protein [Vibrio sinaloensis]
MVAKNIETIFPPAHKVLVVGDTLVYEGMITGEAVLEAMRVVNESDTPVKKSLRSPVVAVIWRWALSLVIFIKQHNLDVEVSELCFSSCANYVFVGCKECRD